MAGKPDTITVPKHEWEQMKADNAALQDAQQENQSVVDQLVEKLDQVQSAQLMGVGIDPRIAARALLPASLVQFNSEYARSQLMSKIQTGSTVIPHYSATMGEVVRLKNDEVERLTEEFPDLLETDKGKFKDKVVKRWVPRLGDRGIEWDEKDIVTAVADLIEVAEEKG